MSGRIQSLFVGINDYPTPKQLSGCISDVNKFRDYILKLKADFGNKVNSPEILIDKSATKFKIVNTIKRIVENLASDDVFLFYYSGHGAQQLTGGRFLEDYNGLHQCMVCYCKDFEENNYLLADKEIRYLFNLCKSNAHIVAIFDCCHSGEITRSINSHKSAKNGYIEPPTAD